MAENTKSDALLIHDAWYEEGSLIRLGLRPAADKAVQAALIPPGGDWKCIAAEGAVTRSIVWNHIEVALVNSRGDLPDHVEGQIAMGLRATPVMDRALRCIFILARQPENLDLIGRIARAAIDYVEQSAPQIHEPESEPEEEEERFDEDEPYGGHEDYPGTGNLG